MGNPAGNGRVNDMQSLCRDGLGFCGRVAAIGGMFVLAFFLIALTSTEWSVTTSLSMGQGLEGVGEAQFGLSQYCIKTSIEGFEGAEYFTCFDYDDILSVRNSNGTWFNETGCNRFGTVCQANENVRSSLAFSCLFLYAGAIWSEKVHINGLAVSLAAGGSAFGMFSWVAFQDSLDAGEPLSAGTGLGLVAGGFVLALLCAIGTCIDCLVIHKDEKMDLCNDGINLTGRIGSALTVLTWTFILLGVSYSDWTSTDDLGVAGLLCNDAAVIVDNGKNISLAPCSGNAAKFALLEYCVTSRAELFGYQPVEVCLDYGDEVSVYGSNITRSGWDRFEEFGLQVKSTACMFSGVIAIATAGLADLFSEKLLLGLILSALACLAGISAMSSWLSFQFELDSAMNQASDSGTGLFLVMGSWMFAAAGSILYCVDYRNYSSQGGSSATTNRSNSSTGNNSSGNNGGGNSSGGGGGGGDGDPGGESAI